MSDIGAHDDSELEIGQLLLGLSYSPRFLAFETGVKILFFFLAGLFWRKNSPRQLIDGGFFEVHRGYFKCVLYCTLTSV